MNVIDFIFSVFIGFIIGLFIASLVNADYKYFRLKDQCKGVIGIIEDEHNRTLEFECVGGN